MGRFWDSASRCYRPERPSRKAMRVFWRSTRTMSTSVLGITHPSSINPIPTGFSEAIRTCILPTQPIDPPPGLVPLASLDS